MDGGGEWEGGCSRFFPLALRHTVHIRKLSARFTCDYREFMLWSLSKMQSCFGLPF